MARKLNISSENLCSGPFLARSVQRLRLKNCRSTLDAYSFKAYCNDLKEEINIVDLLSRPPRDNESAVDKKLTRNIQYSQHNRNAVHART